MWSRETLIRETMATDYEKKTVADVPVRDKRVFVRVDFNVPMDAAGQITEDGKRTDLEEANRLFKKAVELQKEKK